MSLLTENTIGQTILNIQGGPPSSMVPDWFGNKWSQMTYFVRTHNLMAQWLRRWTHDRKVVGLIPGSDRVCVLEQDTLFHIVPAVSWKWVPAKVGG